jgi:diaminopimelate decarboxylase
LNDFLCDNISINTAGNLSIGGCDCVELAGQFNTPLYVMDEETIRNNCQVYRKAMNEYYSNHGMILYASKAFSTLAIYKIMQQEGLGVDVVSAGELYTALKAGFNPDGIYFHGNNKSEDEIRYAIQSGVKRIVVDNFEELDIVARLSQELKVISEIAVRIKPGIEAHTHQAILTGQIDSKFGVSIENGEATKMIRKAAKLPGVKLIGIHCHIGSQIFDEHAFIEAANVMMKFMIACLNEEGIMLTELNLGGGYGIRYLPSDHPVKFDAYMKAISIRIKTLCREHQFPMPFICMEPGRSIVATAGITLYKVGSVKKIPGHRTFITVDGGMGDNPRYALYKSAMDAFLANKPNKKKEYLVTIAGKYCESGDLIQENILMPETKRGDILAVMATGAYNYSMASNYNRHPRPAVVLCKNGKAQVIVRRESLEDLLKNDIIPQDL